MEVSLDECGGLLERRGGLRYEVLERLPALPTWYYFLALASESVGRMRGSADYAVLGQSGGTQYTCTHLFQRSYGEWARAERWVRGYLARPVPFPRPLCAPPRCLAFIRSVTAISSIHPSPGGIPWRRQLLRHPPVPRTG